MDEYKVIYDRSFVVFWGIALSAGLFAGGLLLFASMMLMMLVLISHEYAHVRACQKIGIKINSVQFTWLYGAVDADIKTSNDAVPVLAAGLIDTSCYSIIFMELFVAYEFIGRNYAHVNFANNPYMNFISNMLLFAIVMVVMNALPFQYHHQRLGTITSDGYGAYLNHELSKELWNDMKYSSM